jgi:hypothetical protein
MTIVSSPIQSSKLLLVLASAVILASRPRRDPWPYFYFQTFTCFEMGPPLQREGRGGSDYYRSLPLYWRVTL